jgi:hypothetical protein
MKVRPLADSDSTSQSAAARGANTAGRTTPPSTTDSLTAGDSTRRHGHDAIGSGVSTHQRLSSLAGSG